MRQFVLATNRTSAEQDAAFFKLLRERFPFLGWWHQVSETWLFVDLTDTITASDIRDTANEGFPGIYTLVLQVVSVSGQWAGFGPVIGGPGDIFTWIQETWDSRS